MASNKKYQRYSKETKLKAVRQVVEKGESVPIVMQNLGIRHRDNIYRWIKQYKRNGEAAFDRSIGRPIKSDDSTLENRVKQLEIEVDVLKKSVLNSIQRG